MPDRSQSLADRDSQDGDGGSQQCRQSDGCPEKEPQGRRGEAGETSKEAEVGAILNRTGPQAKPHETKPHKRRS